MRTCVSWKSFHRMVKRTGFDAVRNDSNRIATNFQKLNHFYRHFHILIQMPLSLYDNADYMYRTCCAMYQHRFVFLIVSLPRNMQKATTSLSTWVTFYTRIQFQCNDIQCHEIRIIFNPLRSKASQLHHFHSPTHPVPHADAAIEYYLIFRLFHLGFSTNNNQLTILLFSQELNTRMKKWIFFSASAVRFADESFKWRKNSLR